MRYWLGVIARVVYLVLWLVLVLGVSALLWAFFLWALFWLAFLVGFVL